MPRVYHSDHTAHVRRRLVHMAGHGLVGLLVAGVAAGIMAFLDSRAGSAWGGVVTVVWIADGVLAAIAVLYLLVTVVGWGLYRRSRADLDAAGAEAAGELRARIANLRRGDADD